MLEQEKIPSLVIRTLIQVAATRPQPISIKPTIDPIICIKFQEGPIKEVGVNGCQIEDVIDVLIDRLRGFQAGPFRCDENSYALEDLIEANLWLKRLTEEREAQRR